MSVQYPDLFNTSFPDEVDNFPQFLNMTQTDLDFVKQYHSALEQGDTVGAQIAFNNITNGSQKIISSLKLNQLREAILALERFYGTDIEPYIEEKQAEWESKLNEFTYVGVFNPLITYNKNNMITYSSEGVKEMYLNVHAGITPAGSYPTDGYYWRKIAIKGVRGEPAPTGTTFQFEWDASLEYNVSAIVVYNNAWWIATQVNQGQPPITGSEYWKKVLNITQAQFLVQVAEPEDQSIGDLWFEVLV